MSGYLDDTIARRGILSTGVNFLEKPFSSKGLAGIVRKHRGVGSKAPVKAGTFDLTPMFSQRVNLTVKDIIATVTFI
ncbi:MAG: hypothetical protein JRD87_01985 [Deltaproteobacteria bacterium]|nr:hypothetical protein [Deltaproteobacteria bacterium]MBW2238718.1 hypothetical protein [Deltaproteobacteria bacterium]MBW2571722.1 hypothetical protein [Deltaproteobacteria bacterium]MBW2668654.1 hypothetical protein [Deltaproteobacteria bacterium]MBW2710879.1 hypothetical protein [Deltaproteobacteria bacterium]